MAGLCWMAVLGMFLSVQNSVTAVNQNELPRLVELLLKAYQPTFKDKPMMFSMAVSIPYNEKTKKYDLNGVTDKGEAVRNTIQKCAVYTSKQMVAATVLKYQDVQKLCPDEPVQWLELLKGCPNTVKTWAQFKSDKNLCPVAVRTKNLEDMKKKNGLVDHAEYRVLQHFDTIVKKVPTNDLLLFYSWGSPCDDKCTKESCCYNILDKITKIKDWKSYAFVFSKPFKPAQRMDEQQLKNNLRGGLEKLGSKINLLNIYRCDKDNKGTTVCASCSSNGQVLDYCIEGNQSEWKVPDPRLGGVRRNSIGGSSE
ncbi:uncharacterized protein LOC115421447 [Sphaeramia orbicularis]|uniref:uncharacterized protein LOC115421447 n=1 Tax=Sphaeramia orbicularis TaxID=375764 RepID=UPI00117CBEAB|nr:uncharacterized protein LOC115421447 [Sphaeramia orbicularis]